MLAKTASVLYEPTPSSISIDGEMHLGGHRATGLSSVSPTVSIVLPCLNEERTVGECVRQAYQGLSAAGYRGEVIVADNGSSDRSIESAQLANARIVHIEQRGYGAAIRGGISHASGKIVIMADADATYCLDHLGPFIDPIIDGRADMVIGNRFAGGIGKSAMPFANRYIGNPVLSTTLRILFGGHVRDAHCGLRAFSRAAYDDWAPRSCGMEFASELVVLALKHRAKIQEVPTTLCPGPQGRIPHLRPIRDGSRHLLFLLRSRFFVC